MPLCPTTSPNSVASLTRGQIEPQVEERLREALLALLPEDSPWRDVNIDVDQNSWRARFRAKVGVRAKLAHNRETSRLLQQQIALMSGKLATANKREMDALRNAIAHHVRVPEQVDCHSGTKSWSQVARLSPQSHGGAGWLMSRNSAASSATRHRKTPGASGTSSAMWQLTCRNFRSGSSRSDLLSAFWFSSQNTSGVNLVLEDATKQYPSVRPPASQ